MWNDELCVDNSWLIPLNNYSVQNFEFNFWIEYILSGIIHSSSFHKFIISLRKIILVRNFHEGLHAMRILSGMLGLYLKLKGQQIVSSDAATFSASPEPKITAEF